MGVYDAVTDSDVMVEEGIISFIREHYPDDAFVSEETNPDAAVSGRTWIIDPIDGTVNFTRGIPFYGIQGVFVEDGAPKAAVILFPALGEEFWASEGGAFRNGKPIRTAEPRPLRECILTTGDFSRRSEDFRLAQARLMSECRDSVARFKMFGAACVDFAYLACGRTDVHVRFTNKLWDFLPGLYIAERAGAVYDRDLMDRDRILILCSSGEVLEEAKEEILPHLLRRSDRNYRKKCAAAGSSLAAADHHEVGEEGLELYPLVAALDDPELDLAGLVHEPDLLGIGDAKVEESGMDLPDDVLAGEAVLDHGLLQHLPGADEVPAQSGLQHLLDELGLGHA